MNPAALHFELRDGLHVGADHDCRGCARCQPRRMVGTTSKRQAAHLKYKTMKRWRT